MTIWHLVQLSLLVLVVASPLILAIGGWLLWAIGKDTGVDCRSRWGRRAAAACHRVGGFAMALALPIFLWEMWFLSQVAPPD